MSIFRAYDIRGIYPSEVNEGLAGRIAPPATPSPKEYNGFKPAGRGGVCLSWETGIQRIKELADSGEFAQGRGTLEKSDIQEAYITYLAGKIKLRKKLRVVVDPANGACSLIAPKVFERLGCEVIRLFCEPDGTFPNHEADPIKKKNLTHLQQKVREAKADLGIAYDA